MKKLGGIFLLVWFLFRFSFHCLSFSNCEICSLLYFVGNDIGIIGFLLLILDRQIYSLSKKSSKRFLKVLLIYAAWCLVVDVFIELEIGAHDEAIYTQIDIAILGIGAIWFIVCDFWRK